MPARPRTGAHRCVIAAHLAEGNGHEALRQHRRYLDMLESAGLRATTSPALHAMLPDAARYEASVSGVG